MIATAGCRLAALLGQFPLPRDSAEGEVISSSIVGKSGLSERQVSAKLASLLFIVAKPSRRAKPSGNTISTALFCCALPSDHITCASMQDSVQTARVGTRAYLWLEFATDHTGASYVAPDIIL